MSEPPISDRRTDADEQERIRDERAMEERAREEKRLVDGMRRRQRIQWLQTGLLYLFLFVAVVVFSYALASTAIRFIGAALVPAALIAALGFVLGEVVRLVLGEVRAVRDEDRRRVREAEERIRSRRLNLITEAQELIERELDAMRAYIDGATPPDRPRRATYVRIGWLKFGGIVGEDLETLATEVYEPGKAGTRDQGLLDKINRTEEYLTRLLRYREELTDESPRPSRLEPDDRHFRGYSGYNEPPD